MIMVKKYLVSLFAVLFLFGCTSNNGVRPEPLGRDADFFSGIQHEATFRPGILFSIAVEVNGETEVEADTLRISNSGSALLPIIGQVNLGDMILEQATAKLTALYSPYYRTSPIVRLQFLEDTSGQSSPWGYVTVLGRVRKPGRVSLPPTRDMTVSGAIQAADGFDTSANLTAVRISRSLSDGSNKKVVVDMNRIGEDGDVGQDVRLRAGDVIYVPERVF